MGHQYPSSMDHLAEAYVLGQICAIVADINEESQSSRCWKCGLDTIFAFTKGGMLGSSWFIDMEIEGKRHEFVKMDSLIWKWTFFRR